MYEVTKDNQLVRLNYQKLGNNEVQLNVNSLGKYLVTYTDEKKEEQPVIKDEEKPEEKQEEKTSNHNVIWFIGSALMLFVLGIVIFIKRK